MEAYTGARVDAYTAFFLHRGGGGGGGGGI